MKKLLLITLVLFGLTSCYDQGTILTGTEDQPYKPFIMAGDTIDFYQYFPVDDMSLFIGIHRNHEDVIQQYRKGRHSENIILLDKSNKNKPRIIEGFIMSENDSIVVIKIK